MPDASSALKFHLQNTFGFAGFRASQQPVCEAAAAGQDVLLVMPTGAGKSLCYQLPALARGGTALVISPLIALMDDQAARLASLGLSVARVHSGLEREQMRDACRQYLDGKLQFLFIAPERLRVPGFGEMLAKRKPSLIAIDEAHCISQWGHDFRPDYRSLGRYLPALRPAPVVALTATATPDVQNDILVQLGLTKALRFIHGFRRQNLAIEVVEVTKPARPRFARELLAQPDRYPAIVYAPTRKEAEDTARELSSTMTAAAYHAGLAPEERERVQRAFLEGSINVVVATIAFGMGIDKANVRTVLHTAMPASLESYYQEIGRAGRDGQLSRTILMHSYADRRQHDFFSDRDYPPVTELDRIAARLSEEPQSLMELKDRLRMEPEVFDRAIEKLAIHGGCDIDYNENVIARDTKWRTGYLAQSTHRRSQIDRVMQYTEAGGCRMAHLVQHFGDLNDARRPCGHCDVCDPHGCVARRFREPNERELAMARRVLQLLARGKGLSTGRLHQELCPRDEMQRDELETLLSSLAAAGLLTLEQATFEKDDRTIAYRRAVATHEGAEWEPGDGLDLWLPDGLSFSEGDSAPTRSRNTAARQKKEAKKQAVAVEVKLTPGEEQLEGRLREWRNAEAARLKLPGYCVLPNNTLRAIALDRPRTLDDLLSVEGIGPAKAGKFGEQICRICAQD